MFRLKNLDLLESRAALASLPSGKLLINTLNAHSYNMAQRDSRFAEALLKGDVLLPDGMSIVKACRRIGAKSRPRERVAGWDLFTFEMERLDREAATAGVRKTVMFVGSSPQVLDRIVRRAAVDYPHLEAVTLSPPYKPELSEADSRAIVAAVNAARPDLLWIGMTAPKQEKWTWTHWPELDIRCHVGTVGAVFDFYAGTRRRAPLWWQRHGLEWLYRLLKEPRRMWRRYLVGNILFLWYMVKP